MFRWFRRKWEEFGRSSRWATVRKAHLDGEPLCVACGRGKDLEVHHVIPYHVDPSRELDRTNLVTLCSDPCHRVFGHLMNYKKWNPLVREDAARYRDRMRSYGAEAE